MMISTVNTDVIESILNRKLKFDDFNFKPLSWQDAFIVKLLKWFDKKIETISERKCKDTFDKELIDNWRLYYEQIVRILYHFVIYKNIHDCKQLNKIFSYLFNVDKNDSPYKNNYDMISSEKLISLFDHIRVEAIYDWTCMFEDDEDYTVRDYTNVLIGRWKTKEMKNKLETFEQNCLKKSINNNNNISKSIIMDDDSDINKNKVIRIDINKSDSKTELDEIISDFLKELSKQIILKKIDVEE